MATGKIRTNTDSIKSTQEQLMTELQAIQSAIEKIGNDMNTLNASWTGEAHAAFVANVAEDMERLADMCEGIESIIKYEGTAISEYTKCEKNVADLIAQIHV